jgi:hypothetical protein
MLHRLPFFKHTDCFIAMHTCHCNFPGINRQRNFFINKCIIKTNTGSVCSCTGIIHFLRTCPIQRSHAHRAWLARSIYFTTFQLKRLQISTRISYRNNFCMRWGSLSRNTQLQPLPMILSSFTITHPKGPPTPVRIPSNPTQTASYINCSSLVIGQV